MRATRILIAVGIALASVAAGTGYHWATETTATCTVIDKNRVYGKDGHVRGYRLDTADCGTLDLTDVPLAWEWDASGLYRSIEPGGTYRLTTTGVRIDALGWNPTVIDADSTVKR